jgi:predicted RNA-binding protein with EMAP domain
MPPAISEEELRDALDNFKEVLRATISQASIELDERVSTSKARKINLLWRARIIHAYNTMLEMDDPVAAFVEAWALCVRLTQYLEDGEGSKLYGEHQNVAIDAAKKLELEIENIGRMFLDVETLTETQKRVAEFATANPVRGTYSNLLVFASKARMDQSSPFMDVLNIPMSPFRAMGGVDRGAQAIEKFRGTAEQFSDVVEELPESARWQLLLLLYDMEETEMARTILDSTAKFAESSSRIAGSTEKLPEEFRKQASLLIEEIDAKQSNIQETLGKTEKTIVALERTADSVSEAARAFESTVDTTGRLIQDLKSKSPKKGPSSTNKVSDYRDAAQEITKAANEMRALTAEISELVESGAIAGHIEDANNRVIGIVGQTAVQAHNFSDHLTWRIVQLFLAAFVLALVYRFLTVRIPLSKGQRQSVKRMEKRES